MRRFFYTIFFLIWLPIHIGLVSAFAREADTSPFRIKNSKIDVPGVEIFSTDTVLRVEIDIPEESLKTLLKDNRKYVPCVFRAGSNQLNNVGIHLKGAAGSFRGLDDKPALTISFNRFYPGQRFYGLRKIHLNNSVQDPSYMCENLCGELFRRAGVPTPRAAWAIVTINKRNHGLYVLKEGFTKDFLKLYYNDTDGNLYDGGFLKEITDPLELDSGEGVKDRSDLKALAEAAFERDIPKRWEKLNKTLDVETFISFMVVENMTWDWDGYVMNRNNYRIYNNPETGKMVFFPHGMDQMFWAPEGSWNGPFNGIVARALMEIPQARKLYSQRYEELMLRVFTPDFITNRIARMSAVIKSAMTNDKNFIRNFEFNSERIKQLALARIDSLRKQLRLPAPVKPEFTNNIASITKWLEKPDDGATLQLSEQEGRKTLLIETKKESTGGWRSVVVLPSGRYRFEGLAKVIDIKPLSTNEMFGAVLKAYPIGAPVTSPVSYATDWNILSVEFTLPESAYVMLVCELIAQSGKAYFDINSFQLHKIN